MKFSRVGALSIQGVHALPIDVEVQIISALKKFTLVGLPDGVLKEAKDRVRCAIVNSGFHFPSAEVVVNLRPASIRKEGSAFDLAIAIAILNASDQLPAREGFAYVGELTLDGRIKSIPSALIIGAYARAHPSLKIVAPQDDEQPLSLFPSKNILLADSLGSVVAYKCGALELPTPALPLESSLNRKTKLLSAVRGQAVAKRSLQIAVAGGHNLLFCGAPGSGKSMLAESAASLLPPLDDGEYLDICKVRAVEHATLPLRERPFRSPHYSISLAGLIGGGSSSRPGEASLAHHGILFLDELPEFRREVLEGLRQPLESRVITISRARYSVTYPANFILLAAMNPCPCGNLGSGLGSCQCSPRSIERYLRKLSGPLLDRFDMRVWVQRVPAEELLEDRTEAQPQDRLSEKVQRAREIQMIRWGKKLNSHATTEEIEQACGVSDSSKRLLFQALQSGRLSARGYVKVLRISRTIADLSMEVRPQQGLSDEPVKDSHVAEALSHRLDAQNSLMNPS